jgi:drug/metabolite transporter (DMT)-like permease
MSQTPRPGRDPWNVTIGLLAVQLLFGVHYLISKWIVAELSPSAWALLRMLSASGILLIIWLLRALLAKPGRRFRLPPLRLVLYLGLCSFFGIMLNQVLFLEGIARTTVGHAAVLNSLIPTFALLAAMLMGQERLSRRKLISFLLGLLGVLILLEAERFRFDTATLTGDLLNLANAASYGLFIAMSRRVIPRMDSLSATLILFLFASLGLGLYGMNDLTVAPLSSLSGKVVGGMVFAVLGATVLTYFLNIWALRRTHASHVALYIFLQPIVAALLGVLVLAETVGFRLLLAMLLVGGGLFLRDNRDEAKS